MTRKTTKTLAMFLACAAGLTASNAQAQRFQRIIGTQLNENAFDIETTFDSGYITAGRRDGVSADPTGFIDPSDFLIVKYDKDGIPMWSTQFGGSLRDEANSVMPTRDGGYIVAGQTESVNGTFGLALLRLDPLGSPMWSFVYPGDVFAEVSSPIRAGEYIQVAVRETRSGDFAVVANVKNAAGGLSGIYLRTSPGGAPLTHVTYLDLATDGASISGFSDIKELDDETLLISGFIQNFCSVAGAPPVPCDLDMLALRIDPLGFPLWSNRYYEVSAGPVLVNEIGVGHDLTVNGAAIIAVQTDRGTTILHGHHFKIDSFTGLLLDNRTTNRFIPSFAATRTNSDMVTLTAGEYPPVIAMGIPTGFGAAQAWDPALTSLWFNSYGPLTPRPSDRLEAVAPSFPGDCGWGMTGAKSLPIFGLDDIHLVRANDDGDSGCQQDKLDPQLNKPPTKFAPVMLQPMFSQEFIPWGTITDVQVFERELCYNPDCFDIPCLPDVTTTNTNPGDPAYGTPDGVVNGADLSYYVEAWLAGLAIADLTTTNTNPGDPAYGTPDGVVNGADLSFYVEAWLAGCP